MEQQSHSDSRAGNYGGCGCLLCLIIIGVISALFIEDRSPDSPQRVKAKQSEGKQYVSLMNKAQQNRRLDRGSFANSFAELGISLETETSNYKYSTRATDRAAFNYAVSKQPKLKSYIGGLFAVADRELIAKPDEEKIPPQSILCEAEVPGTIKPEEPTYANGKIACAKGTKEVTK